MADRLIQDNWVRILLIITIVVIVIGFIILLIFIGYFVFNTVPAIDDLSNSIKNTDKNVNNIKTQTTQIKNTVTSFSNNTANELSTISGTNLQLLATALRNFDIANRITSNSQLNIQESNLLANGLPDSIKQNIINNFNQISQDYIEIVQRIQENNLTIAQVTKIKQNLDCVQSKLNQNRFFINNTPGIPASLKQQLLTKITDLDINNQRIAAVLRSTGQFLLFENQTGALIPEDSTADVIIPDGSNDAITTNAKNSIKNTFSDLFQIINN